MSGEFSPRYAAIDARNRLLWRRLPKRLEAEAWRDGILATAGELDRQIGGPSDERLLSVRRRTVYAAISRAQRFASDKFLLTFDFSDPNITAGQRTQTTVPQQELFALNSPFIIKQARRFAARLRNESDTELGRIRRAFELAFGRPPSPDESELAQQFLMANTIGIERGLAFAMNVECFRRHRRLRNARRRQPRPCARSARHHSPPHGNRSRRVDVSLQRARFSTYRCRGQCRAGHPELDSFTA